MKILLTGANGYIGKRLLPLLLNLGHEVICCVRNKERFPRGGFYDHPGIRVYEVDFLKEAVFHDMLKEVQVAYYLIHSMSDQSAHFEDLEAAAASNFVKLIELTEAKQVIYLGGITNEKVLSRHLASRKNVEDILRSGSIPVTALKAGIIVGSGSSSFEIIRDLAEKLPVMIAPKWLNTKTQPIAIRNVLDFLTGVLNREDVFDQSYDIGGPDILTYKDMLLQFAEVRGLRRWIITVPVMSPKISSYWLYFVTNTSYRLASNLVTSMKVEVIAGANNLKEKLNIEPISYREAVRLAFQKIEQNSVVSSWKDSLVSSYKDNSLLDHVRIPTNGCFVDRRLKEIPSEADEVLDNIWSIGGVRGWYYANWLWVMRGFLDKVVGGVGLRRGRTSMNAVHAGDTLDFWRVLVADRAGRRLLLYAEMRLPGEAWLEFRIIQKNGRDFLEQTATFRPVGVLGRLYWFAVSPLHYFVFDGMAANIVAYRKGT